MALLWRGDLASDRLYAQSWLSWRMLTVSAGYFVYDVYVHMLRFEYAAGLAHALGACVVFCVGTSLGILHCYGALPLSLCTVNRCDDVKAVGGSAWLSPAVDRHGVLYIQHGQA